MFYKLVVRALREAYVPKTPSPMDISYTLVKDIINPEGTNFGIPSVKVLSAIRDIAKDVVDGRLDISMQELYTYTPDNNYTFQVLNSALQHRLITAEEKKPEGVSYFLVDKVTPVQLLNFLDMTSVITKVINETLKEKAKGAKDKIFSFIKTSILEAPEIHALLANKLSITKSGKLTSTTFTEDDYYVVKSFVIKAVTTYLTSPVYAATLIKTPLQDTLLAIQERIEAEQNKLSALEVYTPKGKPKSEAELIRKVDKNQSAIDNKKKTIKALQNKESNVVTRILSKFGEGYKESLNITGAEEYLRKTLRPELSKMNRDYIEKILKIENYSSFYGEATLLGMITTAAKTLKNTIKFEPKDMYETILDKTSETIAKFDIDPSAAKLNNLTSSRGTIISLAVQIFQNELRKIAKTNNISPDKVEKSIASIEDTKSKHIMQDVALDTFFMSRDIMPAELKEKYSARFKKDPNLILEDTKKFINVLFTGNVPELQEDDPTKKSITSFVDTVSSGRLAVVLKALKDYTTKMKRDSISEYELKKSPFREVLNPSYAQFIDTYFVTPTEKSKKDLGRILPVSSIEGILSGLSRSPSKIAGAFHKSILSNPALNLFFKDIQLETEYAAKSLWFDKTPTFIREGGTLPGDKQILRYVEKTEENKDIEIGRLKARPAGGSWYNIFDSAFFTVLATQILSHVKKSGITKSVDKDALTNLEAAISTNVLDFSAIWEPLTHLFFKGGFTVDDIELPMEEFKAQIVDYAKTKLFVSYERDINGQLPEFEAMLEDINNNPFKEDMADVDKKRVNKDKKIIEKEKAGADAAEEKVRIQKLIVDLQREFEEKQREAGIPDFEIKEQKHEFEDKIINELADLDNKIASKEITERESKPELKKIIELAKKLIDKIPISLGKGVKEYREQEIERFISIFRLGAITGTTDFIKKAVNDKHVNFKFLKGKTIRDIATELIDEKLSDKDFSELIQTLPLKGWHYKSSLRQITEQMAAHILSGLAGSPTHMSWEPGRGGAAAHIGLVSAIMQERHLAESLSKTQLEEAEQSNEEEIPKAQPVEVDMSTVSLAIDNAINKLAGSEYFGDDVTTKLSEEIAGYFKKKGEPAKVSLNEYISGLQASIDDAISRGVLMTQTVKDSMKRTKVVEQDVKEQQKGYIAQILNSIKK